MFDNQPRSRGQVSWPRCKKSLVLRLRGSRSGSHPKLYWLRQLQQLCVGCHCSSAHCGPGFALCGLHKGRSPECDRL